MTNSHASDDPLLGFDWSVQDERQSDSKSAPSPKFEKKNIASPDAQFPIFADNSRPGRAKSPYHENAMAKKPQHLCGALQYFSIVQFGYAVFMFFIWAYTITILGVSGLNAAFYLTFIGICSVSGWKIQNLELFGISLARLCGERRETDPYTLFFSMGLGRGRFSAGRGSGKSYPKRRKTSQ